MSATLFPPASHRNPTSFREGFQTPVQYIKGVGPNKALLLAKLNLHIAYDLIFHFPRAHQDRRRCLIKDVAPGAKKGVYAKILSVDFQQVGRNLGQMRARIADSSGSLTAVWFKRLSYKYDVFSALKRDLAVDRRLFLFGLIEIGKSGLEMKVEDYEILDAGPSATLHSNAIVPLYPTTEGLNEKYLREIIAGAVQEHGSNLVDPLPESIRSAQNLLPLAKAVQQYHFPKTLSERDQARHRLAFDEFFFLELALALNRREREQQKKGFIHAVRRTLLSPFRKHLQFEFTKAQTKAINEIFRDMGSDRPMHRLLQGDVGSGKTVVALSAILLAIENGHQTAFLAPTEILASQHALAIQKFFGPLPVRWALLTGATKEAERKRILKELASGELHLVVGTHALLSEDVSFHSLGLVVIDEQHRFGVQQRAQLVKKSRGKSVENFMDRVHPDVLIMTATPIPRTLALTLYGDLDISVIDELPPGRSPVKTTIAPESQALEEMAVEVAHGRQAYIVFSVIGEAENLNSSEKKTLRAATKEYERLKNRFSHFTVGLLHGQMKSDEKKKVMEAFRAGAISMLVSTPVIEVGIDVPNATVMTIMNPERFGLAQLHQLRGRVGRGPWASRCILVHDDLDRPISERLLIFSQVTDGFRLAEEDLKWRGPGEIMGEAQHGVPFFKVGNLLTDILLISIARQAAQDLIQGNFSLTMGEFERLNRVLSERFGSKRQLSKIG